LLFPSREKADLDPGLVAEWAYTTGRWKPIEVKPVEVLRRKLCRAFRHEYITDPQGREVVANVPQVIEVRTPDGVRYESRFFPIYKAPPHVAKQHFALERRKAVENVYQMKLNFDSYNDNNEFGFKMPPPDYNFQADIDDMEQPTEYNPKLDDPESEDDGD
jgi:hypothetical protein